MSIGSKILLVLILLIATACRFGLGDYLTIEGDDESYYHASRAIVSSGNLYAGANAVGDIYSFRWLSTWLTALSWRLQGESVFSLTLFQLLASIALVGVTYVLGRRLFRDPAKESVSLTAAAIACFVPIGIQFAATLLPDSLLALFSNLTLLTLLAYAPTGPLATNNSRQERSGGFLLAGTFFALAYFTKEESAKHLLPLLLMLAYLKRWRGIAWFLLPLVVAVIIDVAGCWIYCGSPLARLQAALDNIAMWKRMGMVDPSGAPWSWSFYLKRLAFPFGPFACLFPVSLVGLGFAATSRSLRPWVVWFVAQLLVFVVGGQFGQIQERMLQVLIPSSALLAAYAIYRICHATMAHTVVTTALLLCLVYITLCKFDLRWQAAPRVQAALEELTHHQGKTVYVDENAAFHWRMQRHTDGPTLLLFTELPNKSSSIAAPHGKHLALVRPTTVSILTDKGWVQETSLYTPTAPTNFVTRLTHPLRRFRKEYASYQLISFR